MCAEREHLTCLPMGPSWLRKGLRSCPVAANRVANLAKKKQEVGR